MSDMKVRVDDVFYYPDVMTVCTRVDPGSLFKQNPYCWSRVYLNRRNQRTGSKN